MKAWVQETLGGPLALRELPEPEPGPGEVVLDAEAVGLNFADHLMRLGAYLVRPTPPFVPGIEVVGRLKGARYAALLERGGLAERVTVPQSALIPLPEGLTPEVAAAFPVSFLTAHLALERAGARPAERVLVQAAAGALGTAAVQVAKAMGLRVLASASLKEKLDLPLSLGADVAVTYSELPEQANAWGGVDVLLEVRGSAIEASLRLMAPLGRVVYIGAAEGQLTPIPPPALMRRNLSLIGFWLAPLMRQRALVERSLEFLLPRLGTTLRPIVGAVFSFAEVEEAFRTLTDRGHQGKVVVRLN
jgi:NADPH2:quinone reductase